MIRSVRAAGFAAAAFLLAASVGWSGPLQADEGQSAPVAGSYLDHAGAALEDSDVGLNDAAAPAPAAAAAGGETAAVSELADHMFALADAAMPRPRTLSELVDAYAGDTTTDHEQDCLANAVYFEARGEPIEGQLAVAEVVLNRTQSGRYPETICAVVTQPWQFSFVNATGRIPAADRSSQAWHRAVAIARIAEAGGSRLLPRNVLWYHAEYVSPGWGRRLARNTKIGLHIFYS
ncbi:MAG TPA: cell wall hydrolase [Allosphingosinicella sp.]|nr:cell wall hydrolase [Allosphingosinicella sp.]